MPIGEINMTPDQIAQLSAGYNRVQGQMANGGTVNGMTQNQNLAATLKQPDGSYISNPNAYQQGVINRATADGANQNKGTFNPAVVAGSGGTTDTNNGGSGGNAGGNVPAPNNNSLIQSIYDSMYAAQSQKAKALRDQQLAGLAGQDTMAQNNAQSNLNANDASGARLANQLREHMANLGLGQSGDYISQQVAQNTSQGQNANQINMDLETKLQQLAAQKDAINNNASADDLALLQSIQAQQGQAQLSDRNTQQQFGLQQAGLTGQYNGAPTLAAQGQAAQYTGQYGGQPTLAAQQLATQQQGQAFNQNLQTNQFNSQQAQIQWDNAFKNKQFDQTQAQQLWDNTFKDNSFKQSVDQFAQQMGLDYSKMNQSQQQFIADQAFKNKSLDFQQNQFNANTYGTPNANGQQSIDYLYKQSQAARDSALAVKAGQDSQKNAIDTAYKDAVGMAQKDQLFSTYDPAKQASIIDGYYQHLKPATPNAVSDSDISSYLNKK